MSDNKLKKYLEQQSEEPSQDLKLKNTPVILTDSKGKYLRPYCKGTTPGDKIIWINKSGKSSDYYCHWLRSNLQNITEEHERVNFYIWIGTCDPTTKNGRYIQLIKNQSEVVNKIKQNLQQIKDQIIRKPEQKNSVTFLQIPYFSLVRWNGSKGHPTPGTFTEDDKTLKTTIDTINQHIDSLNNDLGTYSPKFNLDITRTRKAKNGKIRYSINLNLFKDGIHPGETLAKVWLKNISKKITKDCY